MIGVIVSVSISISISVLCTLDSCLVEFKVSYGISM